MATSLACRRTIYFWAGGKHAGLPIEGVRGYFDKITEELVNAKALVKSRDPLLVKMGKAYVAYEKALLIQIASTSLTFSDLCSTS